MPESAACDALGSISIDLLPGGQVLLSSSFMGRQDSLYAPMAQERLPEELSKLLTELRQQATEVSRSRAACAACSSAPPTSIRRSGQCPRAMPASWLPASSPAASTRGTS